MLPTPSLNCMNKIKGVLYNIRWSSESEINGYIQIDLSLVHIAHP